MGNYSGAAGKGETQQCFPKGKGRAMNLRAGQLESFVPQSQLSTEPGFWPKREAPALAQGWLTH